MLENILEYEKHLSFPEKDNQVVLDNDEAINTKYLNGELRIVTEQARYPLNTIKSMIESGNYELHPEFQRRNRWSQEKKSKLIESFIMNVPIPPVFLYEQDFSKYEVLDGLQRLSAIKEFYNNEYALLGLEVWPELNGRTYNKLPDQVQRGIDRRYLSSIILLKETAKSASEAASLKQMVFARINSGGAKLEDQEARNAQNNSKFNDLLIKLSRNDYFCDIFDVPRKTNDENLSKDIYSQELRDCDFFKRMKDVETVLRFFALRNSRLWVGVTLTKFLDQFSEAMEQTPNQLLLEYEKLFNDTVELAYDIYQENTFCIYKQNKLTGKFNWAKKPAVFLYDCVMVALSHNLELRDVLIQKRDVILEETKQLFESEVDLFNGRNTSRNNFENRVRKFEGLYRMYAK